MAVDRTPPKSTCINYTAVTDGRSNKTDGNRLLWDYDMYRDFPVKVSRFEYLERGPLFESHWHEQFQILYFEQGEALLRCNSRTYQATPGALVIINSNEIHYGEALCHPLVYYVVKTDLTFLLSSQVDFCQTKYLNPLLQSRIRFQNFIPQNNQLAERVQQIVKESSQQGIGFELAVKAQIYHILVLLLRRYQQEYPYTSRHDHQQETMHQLRTVLKYVDQHYSENITLSDLASLANMSSQYFCHIFKNLTGKRPVDYINYLRINKAVALLSDSRLNISEIAMAVGFNDSNYFSRLFKKYQKTSPSAMRK